MSTQPAEPGDRMRPPWTLVVPAAVAMVAALASVLLVLWDGWHVYRQVGGRSLFEGWHLVGVLMLPWAAGVVVASAWSMRRIRYVHLPLVSLLLLALVVALVALGSPVDRFLPTTWLVVAVGCLGGLLSPPTWRYQSTSRVIGSKRRKRRR